MMIWKTPVNLAELNQRNADTMCSFLGIEFIEMGDDYLLASMPVEKHHRQPMGIMHGGASCVLAETAGSTAANYCVDFNTHYCVGLDINTNHVKSIRSGFVYAKAQAFHLGKTTQVWGIEIRNADHELISINRLTMAVLLRK